MITQKITVINPEGLHMRPAGVFSQEMSKFQCDVYVRFKNNRFNAKSILHLLSACIKCGSEIIIECNGIDEEEAIKKAVQIIENGLNE